VLLVASVITFLYFVGHTLGMPWTPVVGPQEVTLLESIKSHRFDAMGFSRTYWDFYYGFGLVISGYLLVQAVVLWQLASRAKTDSVGVRPIIDRMKPVGEEVPLHRFSSFVPTPDTDGQIDELPFLAGQGVGLVHEVASVAAIIKRMMTEAASALSVVRQSNKQATNG
jgi:hypothetical protein